MKIDKPEHKILLLDLLNKATFVGNVAELVVDLKHSVQTAEVEKQPEPPDTPSA